MRFSGLPQSWKDNLLMIAITLGAILFYKFLIPHEIKLFIYDYIWPVVLTFFAVLMCILFLPAGIQMLQKAKNGEVDVGPLTPGRIIDVLPVPDEDEEEPGFQYVVSFASDRGLRVHGFTKVYHGEQTYHKGDSVELWDIAKQPKAPGTPRDSRPTYDVDLWDDQSTEELLQVMKVSGWLIVGMTAFWVLAALIATILHLPCFRH